MPDNEKQFETDIESYLISPSGGWQKATDAGYRSGFRCDNEGNFIENYALDIGTLCTFVKNTQPVAWNLFEKRCKSDPQAKFYRAFQNAVDMDGLINVLRHGFKHRGQEFRVVYFKPETELNQLSLSRYKENICQCIRQWHYSPRDTQNTVDMMLAVNGIPLVALELKDQLTGQTIDNAVTQWMTDRDYREEAFQFNRRILTYFAVDLYHVAVSTRLLGTNTTFLPFNQGSNGPGVDGGAGNPQNPDGSYAIVDYESDYDQTTMNIEDVDMSQEARDRYEINRRDTIRFVGYDPFENYPIATDKPRLYSQVVNFLDDESKNDRMKLAAIIQIVKRLNQAEKLNDQVDALLNDPKHSLDNQTLINKMIDTCKKNMDIATNLARDNGISINYNNNKSAGQQTLSGKMKKLTEEGLREAKVNLFDVGTCKGMQQVAEISEAARHKQIGVDENVLSEIRDIKVQLVESMRKERDSAQERARILLRENTDLKDYMKERGLMDASGNLVGGDSS